MFFYVFCLFWLCHAYGMWDLISPARDWTQVSCFERWILNHWSTGEISEISCLYQQLCDKLQVDIAMVFIMKKASVLQNLIKPQGFCYLVPEIAAVVV